MISFNIEPVDKKLSWVLLAMMLIPSFNYYFNNIVLKLIGNGSIGLFVYVCLLVSSFYGMRLAYIHHKVPTTITRLAIILFLLTIVSILLYNDSTHDMLVRADFHPVFSHALNLICFGIPGLVVVSACSRWDYILHKLFIFAPIIVVMAFYSYYLVGFSTWGEGSLDYLSLSYYMLPSFCVCFVSLCRNRNLFMLPFCLLALFVIIAAGSRGAFVCTAMFVALYMWKYVLSQKGNTIAKILFAAVALMVVGSFFISMEVIGSFMEKLGISSRTVNTIAANEFLYADDRNSIRDAILKGVSDNPFGYSLFGDRYIASKYFIDGAEYAHNIIIEFIADFGVILGPVLLLYLIIKLYKRIRNLVDDFETMIFIVFIPSGLFKLFFSGSYLTEVFFWLIIGLLISKNQIKNYNEYRYGK